MRFFRRPPAPPALAEELKDLRALQEKSHRALDQALDDLRKTLLDETLKNRMKGKKKDD